VTGHKVLYVLFNAVGRLDVSHVSTLSFSSLSLSNSLPARNFFRCRTKGDFHLFLRLKESVEKLFVSQAAHFREQDIQNLVPRYDQCLNVGGDYVEKQTKIYGIYISFKTFAAS
jgi:hypothetical protein